MNGGDLSQDWGIGLGLEVERTAQAVVQLVKDQSQADAQGEAKDHGGADDQWTVRTHGRCG